MLHHYRSPLPLGNDVTRLDMIKVQSRLLLLLLYHSSKLLTFRQPLETSNPSLPSNTSSSPYFPFPFLLPHLPSPSPENALVRTAYTHPSPSPGAGPSPGSGPSPGHRANPLSSTHGGPGSGSGGTVQGVTPVAATRTPNTTRLVTPLSGDDCMLFFKKYLPLHTLLTTYSTPFHPLSSPLKHTLSPTLSMYLCYYAIRYRLDGDVDREGNFFSKVIHPPPHHDHDYDHLFYTYPLTLALALTVPK